MAHTQALRQMVSELTGPIMAAHLGWFAELDIFRLLEASTEVVALRSEEGASADGALVHATEPGILEKFPAREPGPARLAWISDALGCKQVSIIPFDIKSVTIIRRTPTNVQQARGMQRYEHGLQWNIDTNRDVPEFYLITLQGVDDAVALLAKEQMHGLTKMFTDNLWGLQGFISAVPPAIAPFIVEKQYLSLALSRVLACSDKGGEYYRNPSTDVLFPDWRPTLTAKRHLWAQTKSYVSSSRSIELLRKMLTGLDIPGFRFEANPAAPLVGDFVLKLPVLEDTSESVSVVIEHKLVKSKKQLRFRGQPLRQDKIWHFLLLQVDHPFVIYCLPRHEVLNDWSTLSYPPDIDSPNSPWFTSGENERECEDLRELIRFMQKHAQDAITAADAALQHVQIGSGIATNNDTADAGERLEEVEPIRTDGAPSSSSSKESTETETAHRERIYQLHLYWLCGQLNLIARRVGHLVFLPLDPGHPVSNHIAIEHHWNLEDKERYDRDQTLPLYMFSSGAKKRRCVPLHFLCMHRDFSNTYSHDQSSEELYMHFSNFIRRRTTQEFILIGGTAPPYELSSSANPPAYLFFPSGFTEWDKSDGSKSLEELANNPAPARLYWTTSFLDDQIVPKQTGTRTTIPFRYQGSQAHQMLREGVNPLRFRLDRDGIYKAVRSILDGEEGEFEVPVPAASRSRNPGIQKGDYCTTVALMNAAAASLGVSGPVRRRATAEKRSTPKTNVSGEKCVCGKKNFGNAQALSAHWRTCEMARNKDPEKVFSKAVAEVIGSKERRDRRRGEEHGRGRSGDPDTKGTE